MRKIVYILIVTAFVCLPVFAEDAVIVRETKGIGYDREEAIKDALYQAVGQAKGVEVSSGDYNFGYRSASADIERTDTGKSVEFDAVSVETGGSVLRTEIEGLVKTYKVLDEKKLEDGKYEVTLRVEIFDYESPEKTDRLTLAVMPMKISDTSYAFGELQISAGDLSRRLSHRLTVALTQANKFSILDRQHIIDFAHERNILLSNDASLEEKAKLGKVLGADYTLAGTVSNAGLVVKQIQSSATGHTLKEYEADFVFDYTLLVGPTRQVKLTETVNIALENRGVKKLVKEWEPEALDYRELADNLIAMVANQVVETLIDKLYPIRIASVGENGQIIINQGGQRISKGLLLEVFTEDQEIIDVDTNESLGKTEILVATIMVEKISPNISYAKLVDGDMAGISEGLICRVKKVEQKATAGRKSDIKRKSTGGVKLPFD